MNGNCHIGGQDLSLLRTQGDAFHFPRITISVKKVWNLTFSFKITT